MENESIFVNYKAKLDENFQALQNCLQSYNQCDAMANHLATIEAIYNDKLSDLKPQIMVYGIYNAGKSSVINELIRDDKAMVADRPMTDQVDYYDWNGYRLADTPGVGAPIEHENVTQEHLKKADVVLFVMSTLGSTERKQNYVRMKEIADTGKRIIIVLNDKAGILGKNDQDLGIIKSQVVENMKLTNIADVEDKYTIVVVNAQRAHKGRTENKEKLYQKSNIEELEKVILAELRKTTPFNIFHNSIVSAEAEVNAMIEEIEQSANSSNGELEKLNKLLKSLREEKKMLRDDMKDYVERTANRFARELPAAIWPIIEAGGEDAEIQEKVNNAAMEQMAKSSEKIRAEFEERTKECLEGLQSEIDDVKEYYQNLQHNTVQDVNIGAVKIEDVKVDISAEDISTGDILNGLEKAGAATALAGEFLTSTAGKQIVKQIAKTTLGKTVFAPVLGVLGPIAGPGGVIITAISILKDWLGNNSEVERQQAEARQQAELRRKQAEAKAHAKKELYQKCEYAAEDFADTIRHDIMKNIDEIFTKIAQPFQESKESKENKSSNIFGLRSELDHIKDEYARIDNLLAAKA